MKRKIRIGEKEIEYSLRKSRQARKLTVSVRSDGQLTMTIPGFASIRQAEDFLREKSGWIIEKMDQAEKTGQGSLRKMSKEDYRKFKKSAGEIIGKRVEEINRMYGFEYGRISIRNQGTRWGSCSSRGNLNFNYKIALMPRKYTDYIIAHELCHLKELNHSKQFWSLVAKVVPNYKEIRKKIRKI